MPDRPAVGIDHSVPDDLPSDDGLAAPEGEPAAPRKRFSLRRRSHTPATERRRRWPRRIALGSGIVVLVVGILVAAGLIYARVRYDEIAKVHVKQLTAQQAGAPFDILMVGSDSRQFVDNGQQAKQFGSGSSVTGQRSDVIIIARFVPATHQVLMLSIPRDTMVDIPGNTPGASGENRINAAFDHGPSLLVETIQKDFGIPINHYVEVNFQGFSGIVDALGGIYLDFSTPVKDKMSGLDITKKGCQRLDGAQALSLVRSRDEYYLASNGTWSYDGMGDWSRIRRQDAFFRAVLDRAHSGFTNPVTLNSFLGATVHDVTIDDSLSESALFDLATQFHGVGQNSLSTEVLPTKPEVLNGSDVLQPAQPYDSQMIAKFLAFGTSTGAGKAPSVSPSQVDVKVLNGNGNAGAAGSAAGQLHGLGFHVSGTGDASSFNYGANEIEYGPSGQAAASLLRSRLAGGATLVQQSGLGGDSLVLIVGSSYAGVVAPGSTPPTTTTAPPTSASNVVFDNPKTLPEPWDPTTCNP